MGLQRRWPPYSGVTGCGCASGAAVRPSPVLAGGLHTVLPLAFFSLCGPTGSSYGTRAPVLLEGFFGHPTTCAILVPRPGIKPASSELEGGCLTSGPPGSPQPWFPLMPELSLHLPAGQLAILSATYGTLCRRGTHHLGMPWQGALPASTPSCSEHWSHTWDFRGKGRSLTSGAGSWAQSQLLGIWVAVAQAAVSREQGQLHLCPQAWGEVTVMCVLSPTQLPLFASRSLSFKHTKL